MARLLLIHVAVTAMTTVEPNQTDPLLEPARSPSLVPGQVLAERYRVDEPIARGGEYDARREQQDPRREFESHRLALKDVVLMHGAGLKSCATGNPVA